MERLLRNRDIISLLLEEVDEDHENDIVFNSSDEGSHEVTEEPIRSILRLTSSK